MAADFAALGVIVEAEEEDDGAFEIWDVNWKSAMAFVACQTQWRLAVGFGVSSWLGLDYAGVEVVLRSRFRNSRTRSRVFEDLRVMEIAALNTFSEVA